MGCGPRGQGESPGSPVHPKRGWRAGPRGWFQMVPEKPPAQSPDHTPPTRAKPTFFTEYGPLLSRLPVLGCRVVSCVCCGAGVMCQTALRASSWPHMHARHSRPPTVYTHAGSLSTTGIEPDSVPAARLPEGEPEPRHTCSRCLVRRKAMVGLQGLVGLNTSILLRVDSPSRVSPLEGT